MRKILTTMLAAAVLLAAAVPCTAQTKSKPKAQPQSKPQAKPLLAISFAGYDRLLGDLGTIGRLGGNQNLSKQLEVMALMLPQGEGSQGPLGLDTTQPWGAVLFLDGEVPSSYAFLPTSDIKPMIEMAKVQSGVDIKAQKGIYEIPAGAMTVFATQKGDWVYVADSKESLKKAAAKPAALLGDLPQRYCLAIRASLANLPDEYRQQLLAQLRAGAEAGMEQLPTESQEEYQMRSAAAKQAIEQMTTVVNDMDEMLLGWNVDAKTKSTYLDLEITARAGTKLAEQLAQNKPDKTKFGGLMLPGAAITANSVGVMSEADVEQAQVALQTARKQLEKELENQGLVESEKKLAAQLLDELFEVVGNTIKARKTDAGMAVMLDPQSLTILAGISIADGAKLAKTVKTAIDKVQQTGRAGGLASFSAETYKDISLHIVTMPTPDPEMVALVGDTLEVAVGIGNDRLLAAAGRDTAATLKKAIDQMQTAAAKEIQPLEIAVSAISIARFMAEVGDDEQVKATAGMVAGMLEKAGDKDHITLKATPIERGLRIRLEMEEGLLKAIGSMTQMLSPPGATSPGDEP